jgi:tetratricopeptide (TPR) repeat protein
MNGTPPFAQSAQRAHFKAILLAVVWLCALACLITTGSTLSVSAQERFGPNKGRSIMFYQQAMEAYKGQDYVTAINLCKKAIGADNANKYAFLLMAQAQGDNGDNYNAEMNYQAALTLDYNFLDCRNSHGQFLALRGKLPEAQKEFEECIRINPKYPYAHHHLGEVLKRRGDLDRAIEEFDTACELKPDYWQAQRDLGLAVFERAKSGDLPEALQKLQIASKLVPDNPMVHYHLGQIHCANGKLDDAEAEFRKALMCDPKMAAAHWELGKLRYFRGDLDRCLVEIKEAEKINPLYAEKENFPKVDPVIMKYTTAVCLEFKGRMLDAVEAWKDYAPMVPSNKETAKHIADIERELKRGARSKKKPLTYDPEEIQALVVKGINQYDNGDIDGAKSTFDRALELNPQSFEAMQNLGASLEAEGDLNGAMAKYQAATMILPKFDGAVYNMAYLLEKLNLPAEAGLMYQKFHELAGKYPYDPKHIVALQQEDARERARQEQIRKRGY